MSDYPPPELPEMPTHDSDMSPAAESRSPLLERVFGPPFPSFFVAVLLLFFAVTQQALFVFVVFISAGALGLFAIFGPEEIVAHPLLIGLANGFSMSAVLLLAVVLLRRETPRAFGLRGFALRSFVPASVAVIGGALLISEAGNWVMYLFPPSDDLIKVFEGLGSDEYPLLFQVFALSVIAPLGEELVFRGFFLHGFLQRYRPWIAIGLTALLFAIIHLNIYQAPGTILLGFVLGWWRWRTGSVFLCIWGHLLNNSLYLLGRVFDVWIHGFNFYDEGRAPVQPWWLTVLGVVLFAAGILWQRRDFRRYPRPELFL